MSGTSIRLRVDLGWLRNRAALSRTVNAQAPLVAPAGAGTSVYFMVCHHLLRCVIVNGDNSEPAVPAFRSRIVAEKQLQRMLQHEKKRAVVYPLIGCNACPRM